MNSTDRPPAFEQQVTFVGVRDLDATAAFYGGLLGLPLVLDQGACLIYRAAGQAFLGFCQHLSAPASGKGVILTLVSPDVDGWFDYLRAEGAGIEKPPTLNERYNIYHCFLRDPDGYLVEIQRFLDPTWPEP